MMQRRIKTILAFDTCSALVKSGLVDAPAQVTDFSHFETQTHLDPPVVAGEAPVHLLCPT